MTSRKETLFHVFYQDFHFLKREAASSIKFTKSLLTLATPTAELLKSSFLIIFSQKRKVCPSHCVCVCVCDGKLLALTQQGNSDHKNGEYSGDRSTYSVYLHTHTKTHISSPPCNLQPSEEHSRNTVVTHAPLFPCMCVYVKA